MGILVLFQILVERLSTFHPYIHFTLVQYSAYSTYNLDYIRVQLYQLVIFTNSTVFKFDVFPGFFENSQEITFISSAVLKDNFPMWPFLTLHQASHRTLCKFTPKNPLPRKVLFLKETVRVTKTVTKRCEPSPQSNLNSLSVIVLLQILSWAKCCEFYLTTTPISLSYFTAQFISPKSLSTCASVLS